MIRSLITFDGCDMLLAELARPSLDPHQVRVQVEVSMMSRLPELRPDQQFVVLGNEFTGTVVECGPRASRWRPGDRVLGTVRSGAFAEEICVTPESLVAARPDDHPEHLTLAPISGLTAIGAALAAAAPPGGLVLVAGAGNASSCILAGVLRHHGVVPIATCRSVESVETFRALGFDAVFPGRICPASEELDAVSGGRPLDAIIDCSHRQSTTFASLPTTPTAKIVRTRLNARVTNGNEVKFCLAEWAATDLTRMFESAELVLELLRTGRASVPVKAFTLDEGPAAWAWMCSSTLVGNAAIHLR